MAAGDPGTITFSPGLAGGGALGVSAQPLNVGVQGGGVVQAPPVQSGASWFGSGGMTMPDTKLPEFLEEITAPNRKALEQQQMWDGFVAARAGATMEEISAETPWYSKVFGPTNYEIGAQNYNVLKSVADMEQDLLHRMPELRKLGPEAMAEEFNRMASEQMTGNTFADALLQKTFMERAGPLMDLHTKERVAWQQAELVKAQYASNSANSTAFQMLSKANAMLGNSAPADPAEADKLVQAQMSLLDGLSPSMYQTDESYKAAITAFVQGAADRGEFHTLKFLRERGVLAALDPDSSLALDRYVKQREAAYKSEFLDQNPGLAHRVAAISLYAAEGIGALKTADMIAQVNSEYAAATGSSDPLYDGNKLASMMAQSAGAHLNAQEAAAARAAAAAKEGRTEADKLAAKQEDIATAISSWDNGSWSITANLPGIDKPMMEASVENHFRTLLKQAPERAYASLVQNFSTGLGVVLPGIKQELMTEASTVLTEQPNDGARALFEKWLAMKNTRAQRLDSEGKVVEGTVLGVAAAAKYFDEGVNTLFNKVQTLMQGNVEFELAYEIARGEVTTTDPTKFNADTRKESEQLTSRMSDVIATSNPRWFGFVGNALGTTGREQAARAMVRAGQVMGVSGRSEEEMHAMYKAAQQMFGLETAGKYAWENGTDDVGNVIGSVTGWIGRSDAGPAIESAIDKALRKHNVEPARDLPANIVRMRDNAGEPYLVVQTIGNGSFKYVPVYGADIRKEYDTWAESERTRTSRRNTFREDAPSAVIAPNAPALPGRLSLE